MNTEKGWRTIAERRKKEAELFELKFLSYRNKLLGIHDKLENGCALKNEIEHFMQDEQGDVEFKVACEYCGEYQAYCNECV